LQIMDSMKLLLIFFAVTPCEEGYSGDVG